MALLTRFAFGIVESDINDGYEEAMRHLEREKWIEAMNNEINDINRSGVIELVLPTGGRKPIPCRWDFDRKRNKSRDTLRWRARLVGKGFKQRFGIELIDVLSTVVRYTTGRITFATFIHLLLFTPVARVRS